MSNVYIGETRAGAGPLGNETINPDVTVNLVGGISSPRVRVRNYGTHEPNCSIYMCWSADLTGVALSFCRNGLTKVAVENFELNQTQSGVEMNLPSFTVNVNARKLVAVAYHGGIYDHPQWAPETNPVCGVQYLP